ncbi:HD domain-containing phosphohydrolase [Neobacillus jeddahensis]|uniref:HD domain-containing phosphohydrolase n=1 Tax=Neobacillus jeddahensis TaxID=1461580 RepID=UPI00058CD9E2|nr:HD domain-containing phosphohydrolase [Neobacillus jeddahensis]
MKVMNWYTVSLVISALISLLYALTDLDSLNLTIFIVMTGIVIILELYPIKLPSGDHYAASNIGFLFLLLYGGYSYSVLAIYLATLAYYLKSLRRRRIPLSRLFVTIGMYIVSVLTSFIAMKLSAQFHILFQVVMVALVFEISNFIVLEGIDATVFRKKMFTNLKTKTIELIIPFIVCVIVLSRLILIKSDTALIFSIFYSSFFLLIVYFFSHEYSKQRSFRNNTTSAFIQVLEGRLTPSLSGHGNRVGLICESLLDDLAYPKRKRNDLVQAAVIHDLGNALIPSHIFQKRGHLTLSEEREYKSHPEKAVEMVKTLFPNEEFSNGILYHHERWDGKGFPKGLREEEIPLEARIIALANELDHILARYHDPDTILKLVQERGGTVLDPSLVEKVRLDHIETMLDDLRDLWPIPDTQAVNELSENPYATDSFAHMGGSFFIHVRDGQALSPIQELPTSFLQSLVNTAIERRELVHETFNHNQLTLDLHAQTLDNGEVAIFAHDVTPYLTFRKKMELNILESYVEVIETLSGGKFKLHSSQENLEGEIGDWLAETAINSTSDVSKCRELTLATLKDHPTELQSMKIQVSVSEAVTNVLKHASGGKLAIYRSENRLQFLISDKGSGIPLHEIPKTILVSGYSSKRSLGQGFKMIANFSDRAYKSIRRPQGHRF